MQVTVNVKEDKKTELGSAFEKRISMLEKLLTEVKKSGKQDVQDIVKAIQKSRTKDSKAVSQMVDSISAAIRKIGSPKVSITQKDNSSELVRSINKRISMLESLIKNKKSNNYDRLLKEIRKKQTKIITHNNIIVDSIRKGRDSRVIPSPS